PHSCSGAGALAGIETNPIRGGKSFENGLDKVAGHEPFATSPQIKPFRSFFHGRTGFTSSILGSNRFLINVIGKKIGDDIVG
ncbi:hypothetical protein PanWU01x14_274950, partial [Parasponia andersonii]